MKKFISVIMCFGLIAFLFSGCGNSKNNDVNNDSSYESDSNDSGKYTPDEYLLARNVFVDKYKSNIGEMQKVISSFDFSEESWKKYRQLRDELSGIVTTFFSNESMVSYQNLEDFNKIKEQVNQYSAIINKIEEYRDKSADEQAAIIADSVKSMNKINLNWKAKVEVTN